MIISRTTVREIAEASLAGVQRARQAIANGEAGKLGKHLEDVPRLQELNVFRPSQTVGVGIGRHFQARLNAGVVPGMLDGTLDDARAGAVFVADAEKIIWPSRGALATDRTPAELLRADKALKLAEDSFARAVGGSTS